MVSLFAPPHSPRARVVCRRRCGRRRRSIAHDPVLLHQSTAKLDAEPLAHHFFAAAVAALPSIATKPHLLSATTTRHTGNLRNIFQGAVFARAPHDRSPSDVLLERSEEKHIRMRMHSYATAAPVGLRAPGHGCIPRYCLLEDGDSIIGPFIRESASFDGSMLANIFLRSSSRW